MWWQVRALLEDRPGALASLARACGDRAVNILSLEVFPCAGDRVIDELVLHTTDEWTAADVRRLLRHAGVADATVRECPAQALEDQPVRYLRAAQRLMLDPDHLPSELCGLLDAVPYAEAVGAPDGDDDLFGLTRTVPFTDTEVARVRELRRLAELVPLSTGSGEAVAPRGDVSLRRGCESDVPALIAMHARCSAETVYRRFHAALPRLNQHTAQGLLEPADGFSLVLVAGDALIGMGTVAPAGNSFECGLVVEDGWQRRGHGTRLLDGLVRLAGHHGVETLTCYAQPDNQAVPATIRRAGLRTHAFHVDGLNAYRLEPRRAVRRSGAGSGSRVNGSWGRNMTAPLVGLLHERAELREICPAADLIDQAVRGGA